MLTPISSTSTRIPQPFEWRRFRYSPDMNGCRELVDAVLARAVLDYKSLWQQGVVRKGKQVKRIKKREKMSHADGCKVNKDVKSLLAFIHSGAIETWLNKAKITKYTSKQIIEHLDGPVPRGAERA